MEKRQEIIREIETELRNVDVSDVFDQLDKCCFSQPSREDTDQLIETLRPVFIQEKAKVKQGPRFKDVLAVECQNNGISELLPLIEAQAILMGRGFIMLTIAFIIIGVLLVNAGKGDSPQFLIIAAPFWGLITIFYEYRAQIYKMEELEAACHYSPARVAAARLLVVLSYNMILCTAATLIIGSFYGINLWGLILNWLSPLLLMLGVALFASLKLGITGGCTLAGALWTAQVTLVDGGSFLQLVLPNLTNAVSNAIHMLLGITLLYISLKMWNPEDRLAQG